MKKECRKCKIIKELNLFNKDISKKDGKSNNCKDCIKKVAILYYKNNSVKVCKDRKIVRDERYDWLNQIKSKLSCKICKENHIACLEFHHLNPKEKKFGIAEGISSLRKTKDEILEEIMKCDVLCANCHRKEHFKK